LKSANKIMGRVYVFRHGQSYDNYRKIFSGFRNSKLTKKGVSDAKILAKKLKDKKIDIGFTSHLFRMKRTLAEALKYHKKVLTIIDDRIIERCYGDLQGTSKSKLEATDSKKYQSYHRSYRASPPGVESIKMVEKRVFSFCRDLEKFIKKEGINVAIVCGNNSMRALRRYFEKLTVKEMMEQENNCINYVEYKIECIIKEVNSQRLLAA